MAFLTLLVSHLDVRRRDEKTGTDTPISMALRKDNSLRVRDTFRLIHTRRIAHLQELRQNLRIEDLLPTLRSTTKDLRSACTAAIKAASNALVVINTQRYKRRFPGQAAKARRVVEEEVMDVEAALKNLVTAIDTYRAKNRYDLLEPFTTIINSHTKLTSMVDEEGRPPFSLRTLSLCFVFQSNLLWVADALKSLLTLLLDAQKKRPDCQLWWPTQIGKLLDFVLRDEARSPLDTDLLMQAPTDEEEKEYFGHHYREHRPACGDSFI